MPSSIKLPSGEVIPLNSVCPPIPKKHYRETNSQYHYRLSKVAGQHQTLESLFANNHLATTITATTTAKNRSISSFDQNYNNGNTQRHHYHNNNHQQQRRPKTTAIHLIARYKHKKYLRSCLNKILHTIYQYIVRKRFRKYNHCATTIQKYGRRYIVLNNLELLIVSLLQRKEEYKKLKTKIGLTKLDLIKEIDTRNKNDSSSFSNYNSPRSETEDHSTLTKDKLRKQFDRQSSNDTTTSSSTSVLKLFKQVSGNNDEVGKLTTKSQSRKLLNGLISSPTLTNHKEINEDNQSIKLQNPKQLYPKKSFSRTLSDVLSRKEMEQTHSPDDKNNENERKEFNKVTKRDYDYLFIYYFIIFII